MKFTQIPADTFKELQLNAGILLRDFNVASGSFEEADMIAATSGGVRFSATPTFVDFGDGIDNCPANMKELKRLDTWNAVMTGTLISIDADSAVDLLGAAEQTASGSSQKITPKNSLSDTDFSDVWWVGDYSNNNEGDNAGFIAVHMMSALSTGGFQIQSADNGKGTFPFTYTAHYSMANQDEVPFELYIASAE